MHIVVRKSYFWTELKHLCKVRVHLCAATSEAQGARGHILCGCRAGWLASHLLLHAADLQTQGNSKPP